jgi:hypothetical protein
VHEASVSQLADGAAFTDVADVGSVADPLENCVEVIVTFHPAPDPVLSPMPSESAADVVWSVPSKVTAGKMRFDGVEAKERIPGSRVVVPVPSASVVVAEVPEIVKSSTLEAPPSVAT